MLDGSRQIVIQESEMPSPVKAKGISFRSLLRLLHWDFDRFHNRRTWFADGVFDRDKFAGLGVTTNFERVSFIHFTYS